MAKECPKCKAYKDCIGKVWYSYLDLRFCPFQVLWIIENSETLREGNWPTNPDGSSNIDHAIRTGYKSEAYFVKPVGILAEVEYRRKRTGTAGKLLKAEILAGLDLSDESTSALMYIKGWRRKLLPYKSWLKQRKYRRENLTFIEK